MMNLNSRISRAEATLQLDDEPSTAEKRELIRQLAELIEPRISVAAGAEGPGYYDVKTLRAEFRAAVKMLRPTAPLADIAWELGALAGKCVRDGTRRDELELALQQFAEEPTPGAGVKATTQG